MTACQALQLFSPPGWSENWATIATGIARPASPSAKRVPRPLPGPAVPPAPFTFAAPAVVPCGTPCGSSPLLACGSVNGPRPITCGPEGAARNTPRPSGCSATFGCASSSLCAATAGLTMSPSFLRLNPLIRPWPYALDIGSLNRRPRGKHGRHARDRLRQHRRRLQQRSAHVALAASEPRAGEDQHVGPLEHGDAEVVRRETLSSAMTMR